MKKLVSIVLALALVLMACGSAFAAFANDTTVSVSGLEAGDTVKYYQVLDWDQTNGTWKLAAGFTSLADDTTNFATDVVADIVDGITQAQANAIAALASGATAKYTDSNITSTTSTYTLPTDDATTENVNEQTAGMGLYMAIITAGTPGIVYNPVFVGADFEDTNSTNSFAATGNYGEGSVAKKQTITVEKTTSDANSAVATAIDSKVGQDVTFYVETTIPVFLDSYTNPSFVINDTISTGIELNTRSIKVKLGNTQYDAGQYSVENVFTVTESGKTGYSVEFASAYLSGNASPVAVKIEYTGKVTNAASFNINEDENTVTVTYSNGPGTETAALRDRTNHYTFSIGADIFGSTGEEGKTYELVKVGVDAAGNPVVEQRLVSEWANKPQRHPLAGATFGLYANAECSGDPIATFKTGDDGIITFLGLDASTYYIKEISAPDGYVKDNSIVSVTIAAHYTTVNVPATTENGIKVAAYSFDVLDYYTVTANNVDIYDSSSNTYGASSNAVVTTYTYDNNGGTITTIIDDDTTVHDSEMTNVKGVELPSTGGIGTTIFYILGGLLVIGAAVILVARRKASN